MGKLKQTESVRQWATQPGHSYSVYLTREDVGALERIWNQTFAATVDGWRIQDFMGFIVRQYIKEHDTPPSGTTR